MNVARNLLEINVRLFIKIVKKMSVFRYQLNNRRFSGSCVKNYFSGFVENIKTILRL